MLKIEKLSKSFGNKPVLQDLELEVQEGSIFVNVFHYVFRFIFFLISIR